MARIDLPYVQRIRDRHGKLRHYFRRKGFARVALPGIPGTAAFAEAYELALAQDRKSAGKAPGRGTISHLIIVYYASVRFTNLETATQHTYRLILDRFRDQFGTASGATLTSEKLGKIVAKMAATPVAAQTLVKRLRTVYAVGRKEKLVSHDPTVGVDMPAIKGEGLRAWTDADIEKFRKRWPEGSRARLALNLLLYTGQRRSDAVRMGRQHVKDGCIFVRQQKTGVELTIPLHPVLKRTLDKLPKDNLTFLMTAYGNAMSPAGFTNWFVDCAKKAGLPEGCGPHGLRKACARSLAEAGCSVHEIAAITGHTTLKEIERYTKSASQKKLAVSAMASIGNRR